jgi:acetyl esterase/lipase
VRRDFLPPRPYPLASVSDITVGAGSPEIAVRIQRPAVPSDVMVPDLHGGGWVIDVLESQQASAARIGASTPATVVQVDYRLAPLHTPSGSAFDDAVAAISWCAQDLQELGGCRLVLAGDSAGGNIAGAALHCRDQGIDIARRCCSTQRPTRRVNRSGRVGSYLRGDHEAARDPCASPALAHLAGLPPTVIGVVARLPVRGQPRLCSTAAGRRRAGHAASANLPQAPRAGASEVQARQERGGQRRHERDRRGAGGHHRAPEGQRPQRGAPRPELPRR